MSVSKRPHETITPAAQLQLTNEWPLLSYNIGAPPVEHAYRFYLHRPRRLFSTADGGFGEFEAPGRPRFFSREQIATEIGGSDWLGALSAHDVETIITGLWQDLLPWNGWRQTRQYRRKRRSYVEAA